MVVRPKKKKKLNNCSTFVKSLSKRSEWNSVKVVKKK